MQSRQNSTDGMTFKAIRGNQGKREFYCIMCTFATIATHFKFNDDPRLDPKLRAQRKLREARIPDIANYIIDNFDNYIFSSITISIGNKIHFNPAPGVWVRQQDRNADYSSRLANFW